jgi:hypothetical protein
MKREPSSWQLMCTILRNHIKPGHTCEQTVNRLWTKNVVEHRPSIAQSASTVYLEKWSLDRLWSLIDQKDITELGPFPVDDPPLWSAGKARITGSTVDAGSINSRQKMRIGLTMSSSWISAMSNHAIDSDTYSAPLRAPSSARHRGR